MKAQSKDNVKRSWVWYYIGWIAIIVIVSAWAGYGYDRFLIDSNNPFAGWGYGFTAVIAYMLKGWHDAYINQRIKQHKMNQI